MKKAILLLCVMSIMTLTACGGGNKEKVYIEGMEGDGFAVEKATATPVPTISPEERDFRGLKWGMTLSDVTNNEGEGYTTVKEGVIRYNNLRVGGFPAQSEYSFEGGKLGTCIYYTTHNHADTNDFLDDYDSMIEKYKVKYGEPAYSEQKWADGADKSDLIKGLETGVMMYRTGWEIGNTRINLVLFKDEDKKIKIGVRYQAIDINESGDVAPEGDIEI